MGVKPFPAIRSNDSPMTVEQVLSYNWLGYSITNGRKIYMAGYIYGDYSSLISDPIIAVLHNEQTNSLVFYMVWPEEEPYSFAFSVYRSTTTTLFTSGGTSRASKIADGLYGVPIHTTTWSDIDLIIWDGNIIYGTESNREKFYNDIRKAFAEIADTDPYGQGGNSNVGGGTGNFDGTSDSIEIPGLPTLSAIGTGFVTIYTPTVAQLHNLANYMWNADVTTLDFWKKIVADPIDLILGLNIVPVQSTIAGTKSVNVGFIDTGISMNYTNSQYVEVDCGTINVNEYWGAYLDYSPYTRAEIYLPYCGYHAIDADEIMGKSVTVKYHVDILSGACTAFVKCGASVLYQFSGSCASAIPVTSSQYGDQVIAAATLAAQLASLPAMGAGAAASAAGAAGAMEAVGESADSYGHMLEARNIGTSLADAASTVTKMKPNIARSGAIGNMAGQLAIQTPYLILSRPRQCLPAGQNTYKGYPANITSTLGNLSGFTVVDSIHLENIPCTLDEQNEIDKFLKTGVII